MSPSHLWRYTINTGELVRSARSGVADVVDDLKRKLAEADDGKIIDIPLFLGAGGVSGGGARMWTITEGWQSFSIYLWGKSGLDYEIASCAVFWRSECFPNALWSHTEGELAIDRVGAMSDMAAGLGRAVNERAKLAQFELGPGLLVRWTDSHSAKSAAPDGWDCAMAWALMP